MQSKVLPRQRKIGQGAIKQTTPSGKTEHEWIPGKMTDCKWSKFYHSLGALKKQPGYFITNVALQLKGYYTAYVNTLTSMGKFRPITFYKQQFLKPTASYTTGVLQLELKIVHLCQVINNCISGTKRAEFLGSISRGETRNYLHHAVDDKDTKGYWDRMRRCCEKKKTRVYQHCEHELTTAALPVFPRGHWQK